MTDFKVLHLIYLLIMKIKHPMEQDRKWKREQQSDKKEEKAEPVYTDK